MANEKNLFDFLNAIFYKREIEYNKKIANAYIITLWLSHDRELIKLVNNINKYLFTLPDEAIYKYFWHKVPKRKRFIKYVKKDTKKDIDVSELCKRYNISEREAKLSMIGGNL